MRSAMDMHAGQEQHLDGAQAGHQGGVGCSEWKIRSGAGGMKSLEAEDVIAEQEEDVIAEQTLHVMAKQTEDVIT